MINPEVQESLRRRYNPEGSELRTLQIVLLDGLVHFDEFCRQHHIRYWLSSGTCLGAIRHQGFIPWDDDIDVEMMREDYRRFIDCYRNSGNFVLQSHKNDLYYTQPFPKLRIRNTLVREGSGVADGKYRYKGAFIDIFVMERSPLWLAVFCHILVGLIRHWGFHLNHSGRIIDYLYGIVKRTVYSVILVCRTICRLFPESPLRHTLGTGLEKNIRLADEIFPLGTAVFEGKEFPVPGNYDAYLRRMYGDYMLIPEEIHSHSLQCTSLK